MGSVAEKAKSVADIATYYAARPSRVAEIRTWARHRDSTTTELRMPWWNYQAINAVRELLPANARVFEYGGGGSTLWLHDLGAHIVTVEHDPEWYAILRRSLPHECVLIHRPPASSGSMASQSPPGLYYDEYVNAITEFDDNTFDFIIVDGRARVDCVRVSSTKVKPGGALLLDDSDRDRYRSAADLLPGWSRSDYRGVKPGGGGTVVSTVWTKPH